MKRDDPAGLKLMSAKQRPLLLAESAHFMREIVIYSRAMNAECNNTARSVYYFSGCALTCRPNKPRSVGLTTRVGEFVRLMFDVRNFSLFVVTVLNFLLDFRF
jgi:hypothetical protein